MAAKLHRGIETRQWTFYRCVGRIQVRVVLMRHRSFGLRGLDVARGGSMRQRGYRLAVLGRRL